MTDNFCISKYGIKFLSHSIYRMRWFAAELPKSEESSILWFILHDENGELKVMLAADPEPTLDSIEDEVDGIHFRWVSTLRDLNKIRDEYGIDYDTDKRRLHLASKK